MTAACGARRPAGSSRSRPSSRRSGSRPVPQPRCRPVGCGYPSRVELENALRLETQVASPVPAGGTLSTSSGRRLGLALVRDFLGAPASAGRLRHLRRELDLISADGTSAVRTDSASRQLRRLLDADSVRAEQRGAREWPFRPSGDCLPIRFAVPQLPTAGTACEGAGRSRVLLFASSVGWAALVRRPDAVDLEAIRARSLFVGFGSLPAMLVAGREVDRRGARLIPACAGSAWVLLRPSPARCRRGGSPFGWYSRALAVASTRPFGPTAAATPHGAAHALFCRVLAVRSRRAARQLAPGGGAGSRSSCLSSCLRCRAITGSRHVSNAVAARACSSSEPRSAGSPAHGVRVEWGSRTGDFCSSASSASRVSALRLRVRAAMMLGCLRQGSRADSATRALCFSFGVALVGSSSSHSRQCADRVAGFFVVARDSRRRTGALRRGGESAPAERAARCHSDDDRLPRFPGRARLLGGRPRRSVRASFASLALVAVALIVGRPARLGGSPFGRLECPSRFCARSCPHADRSRRPPQHGRATHAQPEPS